MSSNKPKILFAGCSFTDDCGFTKENQVKYHWPHLLSNHYNAVFDNIAIGGCSNDEIFLRTIDKLVQNNYRYDLVVVLWSGLSRTWRYFNIENVDDFVSIHHNVIRGYIPKSCSKHLVTEYQKIHYTYFNNQYVETKHWLLKIIALEQVLKNNNIKYIFSKGFTNHLDQFVNVNYSVDCGFDNITDEFKNLLDFDNRPDDYILTKIKEIQELINAIDKNNFIDLIEMGFYNLAVDVADDNMHPGILSNYNLTQKLINHCDTMQLLPRTN